jgi:hypothetical protein
MSMPDDRDRLKPSFISVFMEHPVITLIVAMVIAALVFGHLLS